MFRWPTEFNRLDGGTLWVRPDLAELFARAGWASTGAVLRSDLIRYTRLRSYFNGWDTGTARLRRDGRNGLVLHVKRFRLGWRGCARARREADMIAIFESAGIDCMRIAAVGETTWRDRQGPYCSVFLSEQVGTGASAYSLLEGGGLGAAGDEVVESRIAVVEAVATLVARMHSRDLYHGDLKWKHILPDPSPDDARTWRLIDLERARRATGWAAFDAWITDLWKCGRSISHLKLSAQERELWYAVYERTYQAEGGRFRKMAALRDRAVNWRTKLIEARRPLVRLLRPAHHRTTRLPAR